MRGVVLASRATLKDKLQTHGSVKLLQIRLNKWSQIGSIKKSAYSVWMRILYYNLGRYFSIPKRRRNFRRLMLFSLVLIIMIFFLTSLEFIE